MLGAGARACTWGSPRGRARPRMLTLVHPNEFELPRGPLGVASASTAGAPWWPPVGGTRGLGRFLPSHVTRVGVQGPWAPLVSWHRSIRADAGVLARAALCGRVPTGLEVSGAHTRGLLRCGSQVCVLPHHLKASLVSVTWSRPKSELSAGLWGEAAGLRGPRAGRVPLREAQDAGLRFWRVPCAGGDSA